MISTNSATAIKSTVLEFTRLIGGKARRKGPIDGWEIWADLLDEPYGRSGSKEGVRLTYLTSSLILPMSGHCLAQAATPTNDALVASMDEIQTTVHQTMGTFPATLTTKLKQITSSTSALSVTEGLIGERNLPDSALGVLDEYVGEALESIHGLIEAGDIDGLLYLPLSQALGLVSKSIELSKKLGVLVGLGVALRSVSGESLPVALRVGLENQAVTAAPANLDLRQKLILALAALSGFNQVLMHYDLGSLPGVIPAAATALVATAQITEVDALLAESLNRFRGSLERPELPESTGSADHQSIDEPLTRNQDD